MSGVQQITVGTDEADQRLDRWLRRHYPQVPQGRIERMCRKGEIRVDGGRVKPATRLEAGQTVRVPPIPDEAPPPAAEPRVSDADAAMIRACVIWRDDDIIALNKPPGLAVQGGSGQSHRHVDAPRRGAAGSAAPTSRGWCTASTATPRACSSSRARPRPRRRSRGPSRRAPPARSTGRWSPARRRREAGTIRYGLVKAPGPRRRRRGREDDLRPPRRGRRRPRARSARPPTTR